MATLARDTGAKAKPERVRLYRLPASQVLRTLPASSISLLITDPPYASVNRSGGSGHLRRWFAGSMSWPADRPHPRSRPSEIAPGRTRDGHDQCRRSRRALDAMRAAGFADVRPIVWDRRYPGLGSGLRHHVEYILVGRLPGSRTMSGTDLVSVGAVGPGTADRYPTQKPDGLGRVLARMAGIGRRDLVVDPFCGSGALLVGAAERGATVIGSDISARAIALASKRLAAAARRPPPRLRLPPARPASLHLRAGGPQGRRPLETRHAAPRL